MVVVLPAPFGTDEPGDDAARDRDRELGDRGAVAVPLREALDEEGR